MSVRLYVEGGGDRSELRTKCRKGFGRFLERAGLAGRMPRIVPCGSRRGAFDDFATRLETGGGHTMLLVDAEAAVSAAGPWEHLRARDGWERPLGATDDQCHLMVQAMESWFLADRSALASFYGQGFQEGSLPDNPRVEDVPKSDVLEGIAQASRNTQKGTYRKATHSFQILAAIDPGRVEAASPHARRFLDALRAQGADGSNQSGQRAT